MSGPIVRSAPNKKFSANWDKVFGGAAEEGTKSAAKKSAKKTTQDTYTDIPHAKRTTARRRR